MQGDALGLLFHGCPRVEGAGDHFARVKADPDPRRVGQGGHGVLHGERRLAGEKRVRLLRARGAENRFQTVAQRAEDRAVEPLHSLCHGRDHGLEPANHQFRIETRDQLGRTNDVGEQHGGLLALAARLDERCQRRARRAAPAAKASRHMAATPALGASDLQHEAATRAELVAWRVIVRAIGA